MTEETNLEIKTSPFFKKNWRFFLLLVILIFAFYLRVYHVDYPVVGYHNWKEVHYLTEARNFARDGFFANGFFVPAWDYPKVSEDPSGAHSDSFPTISILVGFLFKIFGINLIVARMFSIFVSLATIVVFYFLIKETFKREDLAFLSAFMMAIMPLHIFFGRQVQLIGVSLFFGVLALLYYLKWLKNMNWKNTIIFSVSIVISVLTKYSYFLFGIILVFMFPYKKFYSDIKSKQNYLKYLFIVFMVLVSVAWVLYSSQISQSAVEQASDVINLTVFFNSEFWSTIWLFILDNFTALGFFFFVLGVLMYFFMIKANKGTNEYKLFKYYFFSSIIWYLFMGYKLQGHNYHQYPLIPLIAFFEAFFLVMISSKISNTLFKKRKYWIVFTIIFLLILYPQVNASKNRMFDTQFPGLDIAGEYLLEHKAEGDRVMHSSHQAYGLLWHGDIKGTGGIPQTVEDIQYAEDNLNATWMFVYAWDFGMLSDTDERFNYIKENYHLVQAGMVSSNNNLSPIYFLFKKGGSYDPENLSQILNARISNNELAEKDYEYTSGPYKVYYLNLE